MDKLIELLNKFERETFPEEHEYVKFPDGTDDDGGYWYYREQPNMGEYKGFNYSRRNNKRNSELNQLLIISKEFGFIKWSVENDKIDRTFREDVKYPYYLEKGGLLQGYEKSEVILMLLSIQDEPIDFLCKIIK